MNLFSPEDHVGDLAISQTGRAGEALTAYYLELHGIQAEVVRGVGADIWCRRSDGTLFTCEVKTCAVPYMNSSSCVNTSYKYHIHSVEQRRCDIHAFVALDLRSVVFMPTSELPPGSGKLLKAKNFNMAAIFPSLERSLKAIQTETAHPNGRAA